MISLRALLFIISQQFPELFAVLLFARSLSLYFFFFFLLKNVNRILCYGIMVYLLLLLVLMFLLKKIVVNFCKVFYFCVLAYKNPFKGWLSPVPMALSLASCFYCYCSSCFCSCLSLFACTCGFVWHCCYFSFYIFLFVETQVPC